MSPFQVRQVTDKNTLAHFIDFPWSLYRSYPYWVPVPRLVQKQIFNPKHPFHKTADMAKWIILRDGAVVGRIAAIVNHAYNKTHLQKKGFFGFFESINDKSIAAALFQTAGEWLRERGMDTVAGPFNPSINYEAGLLIEGFDDFPQIMMTYNPPYYADLLEFQGFSKAKDFYAYKFLYPFDFPQVVRKAAERAAKNSDVTVRRLDKKRWKHEIANIRDIYNSSWEKNWGFVPMSNDEFDCMAKEMKSIVEEKLVCLVEKKGKTIGFMLVLPDYNQVFKKIPSGRLFPFGFFKILTGKKYISRVRVMALGVVEEFRKAGLDTLLYVKALEGTREMASLKEAEFGWVLEDNVKMNSLIKRLSAECHKTYRIYEKALSL